VWTQSLTHAPLQRDARLVSGSCSLPRAFALELPLRCAPLLLASCSLLPCGLPLPTPPRLSAVSACRQTGPAQAGGDGVALSLPFGFSFTWRGGSHPTRYVPCPAHTLALSLNLPDCGQVVGEQRIVGAFSY